MTLTLNDLWNEYNDLISSYTVNSEMSKKMRAVNLGNLYLMEQLLNKDLNPYVLLSAVTDVVTSEDTNYVSLPSDFKKIHSIWYKLGTDYQIFDNDEIMFYDDFLEEQNILFNDTDNQGSPSYCSILDDKIYFDKHFSADGTDEIRIQYYKIPATVVAYDRLAITGVSGDFTVGETITGSTSAATATVYAMADDDLYVDVTSSSVSGTFNSSETITGDQSSNTATTTAALSTKPQSLEWTNKYKLLVPQAWAVQYFASIKSNEVVDQDEILQNMIKSLSNIKDNRIVSMRTS